jgi:hypothetical protein
MRKFPSTNPASLYRRYFFFYFLLLHLACAFKPAAPLQNSERFAEVYAKILIANEINSEHNLPKLDDQAIKLARADSVLHALGFERQQFEAAVKYFSESPERWQEVYRHVVKILEQETTTNAGKEQ